MKCSKCKQEVVELFKLSPFPHLLNFQGFNTNSRFCFSCAKPYMLKGYIKVKKGISSKKGTRSHH